MSARQRFRELSEAAGSLPAGGLRQERWRSAGLFAGPLLFAALFVAPPSALARPEAGRLLAVLAWVVVWWICEAVPIPVTSLLGPALAVLCQVGSVREMFAPFGDPIILFFLGSFILAESVLASGLDRRIAYAILAHRWVGPSAPRLLLAFAGVTAAFSMWLSNTATAAMLYPLALAVLGALNRLLPTDQGPPTQIRHLRYGTVLLLTVAYAASIGGIATPIGTPPNLIVISLLNNLAGVRIPFFTWMLLALPVALTMLGMWYLFARLMLLSEGDPAVGSRQLLLAERATLGAWTPAERNTLTVFCLAVAFWVLPGAAALAGGEQSTLARTLADRFPESVVAILAAATLFILPVDWRTRRFTLNWAVAARIDWGTLLLFGGGLSLGGAMLRTGLAEALGHFLLELTGARSLPALTYLFGVTAIALTETTSNTAAAAMLGPLAIATAQAAHVNPVPPAVAVALGCSMAFMLPVATPPNALVYGSGCVPMRAMVRHGLALNLCCAALVPGGVLLLCHLLFPA